MVKIIFTAILVIHGFAIVWWLTKNGLNDQEGLLQVVDSVLTPLLPIGMPDIPLVEDPEKMKKHCELLTKDFLGKQKEKTSSLLNGLSAKLVNHLLDNFQQDKFTTCQFLKKGELAKATALAKEFNKHSSEANKLRLSFLTAIHELTQKGTKASLPTLVCYIRQFSDKLIAIYPEKDGAKEFVKSAAIMILKDNSDFMEKETGKAPDSCPMPDATTNPSKFNSVLIAINHAVIIVQDK